MASDPPIYLDRLLIEPATVNEISPEQATLLLGKLTNLQALLVARLSMGATTVPTAETRPLEDRLLTPREAAARLGVTVRWLYRHAGDHLFTRRLSRRTLRFSEAGIARYLSQRRS